MGAIAYQSQEMAEPPNTESGEIGRASDFSQATQGSEK